MLRQVERRLLVHPEDRSMMRRPTLCRPLSIRATSAASCPANAVCPRNQPNEALPSPARSNVFTGDTKRTKFIQQRKQAISSEVIDTAHFEKTLSSSRRPLSVIFCCVTLDTEGADEKGNQNGDQAGKIHVMSPCETVQILPELELHCYGASAFGTKRTRRAGPTMSVVWG
jgi:hypothetical protein